ncbi:MAG: F0F1 ATP synthase subunit B [Planctomycetes bacterium]|nr:F0F1 ATP synthase subunit B [Planctomycetota bacterium]
MPLAMLTLASAGGGGGASLHLLPDLATLIQSVILFTVLVVVLGKFAWPKILHALEEREHHIRDEIAGAERGRKESERLLGEHRSQLEAARAESRKIIEEGRADALKLRETMLEDARRETGAMAEHARREIGLAEAKAREGLRQEAVNLATDMASKVLGVAIRPEDHRDLLNAYVREVESRAGRTS